MTPAASSLAPRPLLGGFLLLAALGAATWAAVIAFWYAQRRVVNLQDVLLYLLALPLLLFAGVLLARRALRAAGSAAPAAVPAGLATDGAAGSGSCGADWPVLGAWVGCAGGSDLDLLVSTLAHELPHPAPDPWLRDADGLPVPSARIAALEPAAVEAALPEGVNLSPLLDQVGETLAPGDGEAAGPARSTSTSNSTPALHVLAHWPSGWSASETAAAQAWLAQRLPGAGARPPAGVAGGAGRRPDHRRRVSFAGTTPAGRAADPGARGPGAAAGLPQRPGRRRRAAPGARGTPLRHAAPSRGRDAGRPGRCAGATAKPRWRCR